MYIYWHSSFIDNTMKYKILFNCNFNRYGNMWSNSTYMVTTMQNATVTVGISLKCDVCTRGPKKLQLTLEIRHCTE